MSITYRLIAPCGMNCGICMGYLRTKNHCPGCRVDGEGKNEFCVTCIIKNCDTFKESKAKYCYECKKYPCRRMKQLDKRYRTRYGMSMFENLANIEKDGIREFVKKERKRWTCKKCGGTINVHRWNCYNCGAKR